ncbi:MAG: 4Fe-4S dicluster domain-containing protein [Gammaproteobacteria bacterium]|nr:4Fe-4S dicluster domain-containing protein [Gammaproteobacteria bacterium]
MSCHDENIILNNKSDGFDFNRRRFLSATVAAARVTLASGVTLYGIGASNVFADPPNSVSNTVRWGMLIDASKCDKDCNACVTACSDEHGLTNNNRPTTDAHWIRKVELTDSTGHASSLPVMCQHCEKPPCVDVCPTGASFKRDDGIVLVDKHICIGCRYCIMACPYKARSFIHEVVEDQKDHAPRGKGTVEGCTMCVHRVDEGLSPACVDACASDGGKAMLFGDLSDPESELSKRVVTYATQQIRADLGTNPGIRYRNI